MSDAPATDDEILKVDDLDQLIDRGLDAVESEDLEKAERILDAAGSKGGENHPRVLHLAGMLAWAQGDMEHATGYLMQATDQEPDRAEIYLDAAECLFLTDELSEAESVAREALDLAGLSTLQAGELRLLLAQIRLADDDPEESLELLDGVAEELKEHSAYLSTRGAALLASGKAGEAVDVLRRAADAEPDDPEYAYQLAVAFEQAGRDGEAAEQRVRVLELDIAEAGGLEEPTAADVAALRSSMEDVLEELPDPILALVANARIDVLARASASQVRSGVDPRAAVFFEGQPKRDGRDGQLDRIVVVKDVIVDEAEDDEDVPTILLEAMVDEIQTFFATKLVHAEA